MPRTSAAKSTTPPSWKPYDTCAAATSAAEFIPKSKSLPVLEKACQGCRGCPLYCNATQAVFGEGPKSAHVLFVGEQPGDQEDRTGQPFVGPAGRMLDEALETTGIPRKETYVTNAVKHFKWEPRGTRRIHSKPSAREVAACRPWLEKEIELIQPKLIVCLGATAAQSLLGSKFRLTQHRGEILESNWAPALLATVHPSSILRAPDRQMRQEAQKAFFDDMWVVSKKLQKLLH